MDDEEGIVDMVKRVVVKEEFVDIERVRRGEGGIEGVDM